MIAIDRGEEPDELVRVRDQRLALAELEGRPQTPAEFAGYDLDEVCDLLLCKQEYRCAYCEKPIEERGDPIEHLRPKDGCDDVDWDAWAPPDDLRAFFESFLEKPTRGIARVAWKARDKTRYWWLAWTWENLLYACVACNTGFKCNRFPCERGSRGLVERQLPPGAERSLLVDPTLEDPLDHLRFGPDLSNPSDPSKSDWGPVPLTERGRWTIAVLGLNRRQGLRENWRRVARTIVNDPDFKAACDAAMRGDFASALGPWDRARARLLAGPPTQDFLALRWCVFDHYIPEAVRTHASPTLALPRPRAVVQRTPRPLVEPRPELGALSPGLALRVRALGPRAKDRAQMQALLLALCGEQPSTVAALAKVVRRDDVTDLEVAYLRPLSAGETPRLTRDPATGVWSLIATAVSQGEP